MKPLIVTNNLKKENDYENHCDAIALLANDASAGCGIVPVPTETQTVAVQQPQVLELSVVIGKTTKQEILDALGMPKTLGGSLHYSFNENTKCKLNITEKDDTKFNIILGKGEKYHTLIFHLDYKNKNIIEEYRVW